MIDKQAEESLGIEMTSRVNDISKRIVAGEIEQKGGCRLTATMTI